MSTYAPFVAAHEPEGHVIRWTHWDGDHLDTASVRWENEGFTITGNDTCERVEWVLRLSPTWQVRQFILFRDMEEPDLWLATDGGGRWGEMNGAHRTELDGCYDVMLDCSPFTLTLPVRRLPLQVGHAAEVPVVHVDTDTLEARAETHVYGRLDTGRWRVDDLEFEVDEHGVVTDLTGRFRRV